MIDDDKLAMRGTGTVDDFPMRARQQYRQQREHFPVRPDATPCAGGATWEQAENPNVLPIADLCDDVRKDAAKSETAPCRTRTYNPLIKSQLLCQLS